ncbi:MAG: ABC transporter [Actinobacteria bacterium HGW-Actinobacteria-4]|nr:MAG: ABC transporter [Actinobacteria bacterium HGW-Actinobacteria-4]
MTPTFQHLPPRDETTVLRERVNRLRASMEWASEAIPAPLREEIVATIQRCDERLDLGVDHTVVALAGGTGSGKSSLFNALVGQDFAVPGIARPTTSHVSAASWGPGAKALLDWIGVDEHRRLEREVGEDPVFAGMVLLDLPDHDSINAHNRDLVDYVLPMADLLMWVVDPQKYADHALHSAYVTVASDHGQPSVMVLNHVDRLAPDEAVAVVEDLQRLLAVDGLEGVGVVPVSATTGQGVEALRAEIRRVSQERSVAAQAVRSDLVTAGRALAAALSRHSEPQLPDVEEMVAAIARAAGVDARADAAAAVAAGRAAEVPELGAVTLAAVERERLDWVDAATVGLPITWRTVVNEACARAKPLTADVNAALAAVAWPEPSKAGGWRARLGRSRRAAAAHKAVLGAGRDAVRTVLVPLVAEPTMRIHESYRVLHELTELS